MLLQKSICQNPVKRRVLVRACRKIRIPPRDRNFVPLADSRRIRLRQIRHAVRAQHHHRRRIIHHRGSPHRARRIIVLQPERVPHFVRRKLPQSRERHLLHLWRNWLSFFIRREQSLRDQKILPHAQRPERHLPLDNFPRPRIDDAFAIRPAARRAMHPLNHVVAQIHRVRALRHHLDAKRIPVSCCLKRLLPPVRAFQQRRPNRLRRPAIEVIHDRLDGLAHRRARIFFLQAMPRRKPFYDRLADRRRIIHVRNPKKTRARIVRARLVSRRRQLHKRMMLAHRDRLRRRRHIFHPLAGMIARERQRRFDFSVQRKIFRPRQVKRTPLIVEPERPLLRARQNLRHVMCIAQEKLRRIHQHVRRGAAPIFRRRRKSPQRRLRKRLPHRRALVRIARHRTIIQIRLDQQNLRPDPLKPHDARLAHLPAVQPDVVRPDSRRQRRLIQKLRAPLIDLQPNLPRLRVPIKIEISRQLRRILRLLRDARCRRRRIRHACARRNQSVIAGWPTLCVFCKGWALPRRGFPAFCRRAQRSQHDHQRHTHRQPRRPHFRQKLQHF